MAFVLLPCDLPTWPTMIKALNCLKEAKSVSRFTKVLLDLFEFCNVGINPGSFDEKPRDFYAGLESFLNEECEENFFSLILPKMINLALEIKELRPPQGVQYFLQQEQKEISLPRRFVASLLAHIFFCTWPRRTIHSHPTLTDPCIAPLLSSLQIESQRMKLKAFLNYFRLLSIHESNDYVKFSRKVKDTNMSTITHWTLSPERLCPFALESDRGIQDDIHTNAVLTYFTSPSMTKAAFSAVNSQEVELMVSFPEILVVSVLAEHLQDNEVFQVSGILRTANVGNLKTKPSCILLDTLEAPNIIHNLVDAQNYASDNKAQYKMANILRELNKAYLGFSSVTVSTSADEESSSSDFISISRQHSDEDSGVPRDRIYSSEEKVDNLDEKQRRIRSFCQRGYIQRSQEVKAYDVINSTSASDRKLLVAHSQGDDNVLSHLTQPSSLPKDGSTRADERREEFADARKINSSISSEGIKSLNRNIHRKRKKRRRNKNSSKNQNLTDFTNEPEKGKNQNSRVSGQCSANNRENEKNSYPPERAIINNNRGLPKDSQQLSQPVRNPQISFDAPAKDSDYMTAEINDEKLDRRLSDEASASKEPDVKSLMERMFKAVKYIEKEKIIDCEGTKDFSTPPQDTKPVSDTIDIFVAPKVPSSLQHESDTSKLVISNKKVTHKPPLPKSASLKKPQVAVAQKSNTNDEKPLVTPDRQKSPELSCSTADEDIYFSAFESLELQDGTKTLEKNCKKKGGGRKACEKEARRKKSFAQRLKETLRRGHSIESTTKEDGVTKEEETSKCSGDKRRSSNKPFVIRKLSGDLSFDDDESLEPLSNRFQNEEDDKENLSQTLDTASDDDSQDDSKDESEDSDESGSSRYSFSSDYSSDLNKVYEQVEEMLQTLDDNSVGPRGLAVKRFSRSILKRGLSDSYKGVVLSLNGTSQVTEVNATPARSVSLVLNRRTEDQQKLHRREIKFIPKMPGRLLISSANERDINTIISGNWGCGKQKGNPQLKVMLQWAAASKARGTIFSYHSYGIEDLSDLQNVVSRIQERGWNVGDLIQSILDFISENHLIAKAKDDALKTSNASEQLNTQPHQMGNLFEFLLSSNLSQDQ